MKTIIALAASTLLIAACNTVEGVGEDIKDAGTWTSETAKETKEKLD